MVLRRSGSPASASGPELHDRKSVINYTTSSLDTCFESACEQFVVCVLGHLCVSLIALSLLLSTGVNILLKYFKLALKSPADAAIFQSYIRSLKLRPMRVFWPLVKYLIIILGLFC